MIQGEDSFDPIPTYCNFDTLGILQADEEEIRNKEFQFKITWRTKTTSRTTMVSLLRLKPPTTCRLSSESSIQWLAIIIQARVRAGNLFTERPEDYSRTNDTQSSRRKFLC